MTGWRIGTLREVCKISTGFAFRGDQYESSGSLRVVRGENITIGTLRWDSEKHWNHSLAGLENYFLAANDIVIGMDGSRVGQNRAKIRAVDLPLILAQRVTRLRAKEGFDQDFIWYQIIDNRFKDYVETIHTGTSIPHISMNQIGDYEVTLPSLPEQKAIASILSSLDDKIDLLHRQNKTLEAMAETLFRQWFVEEADKDWKYGKLKQYVDIGIGRTPPRQEHQWFSGNETDVKWISIKDLGNDGVYIFNTAEYLTRDAIRQFNIPIIPENTVVLSFKMTVGRVAITTEQMLSNEAIAHFKFRSNTPFTVEYLYMFLKSYQYELLGSTSSIVTAINSAMIKDMEIAIPNEALMERFDGVMKKSFEKIRGNQLQIRTLEKLRDTLLPKLMSGEVRVAR